jgi:hypothetical protein
MDVYVVLTAMPLRWRASQVDMNSSPTRSATSAVSNIPQNGSRRGALLCVATVSEALPENCNPAVANN